MQSMVHALTKFQSNQKRTASNHRSLSPVDTKKISKLKGKKKIKIALTHRNQKFCRRCHRHRLVVFAIFPFSATIFFGKSKIIDVIFINVFGFSISTFVLRLQQFEFVGFPFAASFPFALSFTFAFSLCSAHDQ